jgi:hypothetical protein
MHAKYTETNPDARWICPTIWVDEDLSGHLVKDGALFVPSDGAAYKELRKRGVSKKYARSRVRMSHGAPADASFKLQADHDGLGQRS